MKKQISCIQLLYSIAEESSGPSYSVRRLCEVLIEQNSEIKLASLEVAPVPSSFEFCRTFPVGLGPRWLGHSPKLFRWLRQQANSNDVDILHSHGMWQMNTIYPSWIAKKTKLKLIISPRGSLSEWSMEHGSIAKKVFWPLLQKSALEAADCFHATALSEYEEIRKLGFKQPVAVIPNGIDIPNYQHILSSEMKTLLFLGRIHPKKGLDLLLTAWSRVFKNFPNWTLAIVGSDREYDHVNGHLSELKLKVKQLGLKRVKFFGELHGVEKMQAYQRANLFVLPTFSENFGLTVAESLASGTPVIVSKGAPWQDLEKHGAGWWINIGADALTACLQEALACSERQLFKKGQRGRTWMEKEFSWQKIGKQMIQTYEWMLGIGSKPDCIIEK